MTVRVPRLWRMLAMGLVMVAAVPSAAPWPRTLAAQVPQDKAKAFDEEFERGRQLLQRLEYFEALKVFQRANQLAAGKSAACFLAMAQAMQGMKAYQNAVDAARSAIELAGDDSRLLARAHNARGLAFQALAGKDATKLRDAEAEFRQALAADPESRLADFHYNLAVALIKQGRDDEGIAELKRQIDVRPRGTTAEQSRALIANPRRARESYAPDFTLVSSAGETISLETLRGKVVLLDFWASSCAACVKALPSIRKLQNDHAKDPFVLVGISADDDERAWRVFVSKNGMSWPQFFDDRRHLRGIFDVQAIPTYVLIDGEGIVRMQTKGSGFHDERALGDAVDQQIALIAPRRP